MKLFKCQHCSQILYFENTLCERCGHRLGYLPDAARLLALEPAPESKGDLWCSKGAPGRSFRFCTNEAQGACNWLLPAESAETLCLSCRHNRTIPDVSLPENLQNWRKIEIAKHRLFYSLLRLGLPLPNRNDDPANGLAFDFLAAIPEAGLSRVTTGHDNGLITIALAEADDAYREKNRVDMNEPYRTLLGHFRHESGHYFWDRLVRDADDGGARLAECRALFGDDGQDYGQALQAYYAHGAPPDWQARFVSTYASAHPWEDFAETWAHYLHIVDALEMAGAFGLSTSPAVTKGDELDASVDFDPYRAPDLAPLIDNWLPLSLALNSLNRAMGQPDLYPFVLSTPAIDKLRFVHGLVHGGKDKRIPVATPSPGENVTPVSRD